MISYFRIQQSTMATGIKSQLRGEKPLLILTALEIGLDCSFRASAHQANWQPQRNRNFRELLAA
jgi:hypothetical protein